MPQPAPAVARARVHLLALVVCGAGATAAAPTDRDSAQVPSLPPNIQVDAPLKPVVDAMLADSPTFGEQCARLRRAAELRLRVRLTVESSLRGRAVSCRAECEIRRYEHGLIDATVRLKSKADAAELIAHEIEHVIEFLDGVNHRLAAAHRSRDAWAVSDGRYETARAIDTGKRVARELATRGLLTARVRR